MALWERWTWLRILAAIGITAGTQGCAELAALVPAASNLKAVPNVAAPPGDKSAPPSSEDTAGKEAHGTVVPIPLSDPTVGSGLAVVGMYFHAQSADEVQVQPPSLTAAFAMATDNGSKVAGVAHMHYWDADQWRFSGVAGYAHLNLDFFGGGGRASSQNNGAQWTVDGTFVQPQLYHRIAPNWYLGAQMRYASVRQSFGFIPPGAQQPSGPLDVTTTGAGLLLQRDTRDNKFNPYDGSLLDFNTMLIRSGLGGDVNYDAFDVRYRKYMSLRPDLVLATDLHGCARTGDVPLFDDCFLQLRGFSATRYIGRYMGLAQAELRWRVVGRIGLVAFAGTGVVANRFGDLGVGGAPVGFGVGFRYMVLEAERINLRVDVARGGGSRVVYLSVTEAF